MDDFRKQAWINAGLILLGFAVCVGGAAWLAAGIRERAGSIVTKRAELKRQSQMIRLLADFKTISGDVRTYAEKLKAFVPPEEQLLDFRRWIEGLGASTGVSVSNISFVGESADPSEGAFGHNGFGMNAEGSSENLKAFFQAMATVSPKYLTHLVGMRISESGSTYSVHTNGRVYFR